MRNHLDLSTIKQFLSSKVYMTSLKINVYAVIIFFYFNSASGQSPNWIWAQSALINTNVNSFNEGISITTDLSGNIYMTGFFQSSFISFGSIKLYNTDSTVNTANTFIVKYDPLGNVLWAKKIGNNNAIGRSISCDLYGNVLVTGNFQGDSISFDTINLINADTSGSTDDIFIAKYNNNGKIIWAKRAGGKSNDYSYSVTNDILGNVLFTGKFSSTSISFDTIVLSNNDTTGNSDDILVVKYDNAGKIIWAKSVGGNYNESGMSITTNLRGEIFVSGNFQSQSVSFGNTTLINTGILYTTDAFVLKYKGDGNIEWVKSIGGINNESGQSITSDTSGNIYVTGSFDSKVISVASLILRNSDTACSNGGYGCRDIFIAKYNSDGNLRWAKSVGGIGEDDGSSIAYDFKSNLLLSGSFASQSIIIGSTILTNTSSSFTADIFIANYDTSGNLRWAKSAGGADVDACLSSCVDISGNCYLTGFFRSPTLKFGNTTLINTAGYPDYFIYISKLGSTTGIDELQHVFNSVKLFPNPAQMELTVFTISKSLANSQLSISDMFGRKVLEQLIFSDATEFSISIQELKSGVYFLTIQNGGEIGRTKFIKE